MEAGKQSSSSFTSDLFGAKDSSSSSSSKILSSIFPPPPNKVVSGRESIGMSENEKKTAHAGDNWISKDKSRYFQEEETPPFQYSSSIYYGGQDVYTTQPKTFIKEVGKDDSDSGSASRGNWWQGSLYY